jgi:hypothetical protein
MLSKLLGLTVKTKKKYVKSQLNSNNMENTKFYWNPETIEYYVDLYDLNGFASVAIRVLDFVTNECSLEDGETTEQLFASLMTQIENNIQN